MENNGDSNGGKKDEDKNWFDYLQTTKKKKEEKILLGLRGQNSICHWKKVTKNEKKNCTGI